MRDLVLAAQVLGHGRPLLHGQVHHLGLLGGGDRPRADGVDDQ